RSSDLLSHQAGPSVLVLSRQSLPCLGVEPELERGGYVVRVFSFMIRATLMSRRLEVPMFLQARTALEEAGIPTRVVSLPCWELFFAQPKEYQDQVLGPPIRVAVEAASRLGWHELVGGQGTVLSLERFGGSGQGDELMRDYGFTPEAVVAAVRRLAEALDQLH
ncbi:MAG: transketolase, partial [Candidatus Eremiobacteraeota bacterium]|nr:transketolase [Candidatus Eremiobacteraeota bacterium]